ncbi:MAG: class A beta-lactamase-related serine hydrolase [Oscillospiraceae bacterium]|nr:class A beta-lactamase-related serine hydrolase [Oscillospiraceae bacterium]
MKNRFLRSTVIFLCVLLFLSGLPLSYAEEEGTPSSEPETVSEAVSESETADEIWERRLLQMLESFGADPETIGAGYCNLVTGEEHYYLPDQYRISGSMYKVPLNMLFLDWIDEGIIDSSENIYGYAYQTLLDGTVIHSSNDNARTLWTYAGDLHPELPGTVYHRYRMMIAHYMGEDPNNVDDKYYENNFFTPRQMLTCLKNLYEGRDRYARLITAMQEAEPEKYFKLHEQRFQIAHKYGWFVDDSQPDILYLNDCALCFTEEPIAIVLFTGGTEGAYGVLGAYSTLMCDYVEAQVAEKKRQAAAAAAAGTPEPTAGTETPAGTGAPTDVEKTQAFRKLSGLSGSPVPLMSFALTFAALAVCALLFLRERKNGLRLSSALIALLLVGLAILAAVAGWGGAGVITAGGEDPGATVARFFEAMKQGDYETAQSCMSGNADLNLNGQAQHADAWRALRESWDCSLSGAAASDRTTAWQEVQIRTLDFSLMEDELKIETREQLLNLAYERTRQAVYDENGEVRPEAAREAYDLAMSVLLQQPESYYRVVGAQLELRLTKDGWKLAPTRELLNILSGQPA